MASSKLSSVSTLVLRVLTLLLLIASALILVTDKVSITVLNLGQQDQVTFKDFRTYKFVLATVILGVVYTVIQIPFAIYFVCTEKRMIRNDCLPQFDFYGDKMVAFILAIGAGAGFGVTTELKLRLKDFINLAELVFGPTDGQKKLNKFLNLANFSFSLLFFAFLCMAILSVISSYRLNAKRGGGFFR